MELEIVDKQMNLVSGDKYSMLQNYHTCITDCINKLNDYLLLHYDVASLSSKFWSTIHDIGNGIYKHKRCKPIDCNTLLDMWKLYQKELNQIYVWNKSKGNDMTGEGRVIYDLAILMRKYGEYLKHVSKIKAIEADTSQLQQQTKINYNNFDNQSTNTDDDISSLLDEIF